MDERKSSFKAVLRSWWSCLTLAVLSTVIFGQYIYAWRESGGYLEENLARLSGYHLLYLVFMTLTGLAALLALAYLLRLVTGSTFAAALKDRALAASPLILLLPCGIAYRSMHDAFGPAWPLFFIGVSVALQLYLAWREAKRNDRMSSYYIFLALFSLVTLGLFLRLHNSQEMMKYLGRDDSVLGLMGRHILYDGARPVFYYGQAYNSSIDAYLIAYFFYFLGPTALGVKLSSLFPSLAVIPVFYFIGKELYDGKTGMAAAVLAALPPGYMVVMASYQLGGYGWTYFLTALSVYLALRMSEERFLAEHPLLPWLAMGFMSGLMFYLQPISIPVVSAILLFLMIRFYRFPLLAYASSFAAGCLPLIRYNISNRFATLDVFRGRMVGGGLTLSTLRTTGTVHLLVLLGIKRIDTLGYAMPRWLAALVILVYGCSVLYMCLRLAGLLYRRKATAGDVSLRKQRDGLSLLLLLLLSTLLYFAVSIHAPRLDEIYPHLIMVACIPLLLGVAFSASRLVDLLKGAVKPAALRKALPALLAAVVILLVAVNLNGLHQLEHQEKELAYSQHDFSSLIEYLEARGIDRVYTGYMHTYKLVFESGEAILVSPNAGPVKLERYPAYTSEVDQAERIAVVFNRSYTESIEIMETALEREGITYVRDDFENYVIFRDFSRRPDIYELGLPEGLMSGVW